MLTSRGYTTETLIILMFTDWPHSLPFVMPYCKPVILNKWKLK